MNTILSKRLHYGASQPQVETIHFTFQGDKKLLYFRNTNRSIRFLHYHCPRIVHNSKLSKIPAQSRSSNCKHRGDAQSLSARILDFIFPTCITFLETRKKISALWPLFLLLQELLAFSFLLKKKNWKKKHSWYHSFWEACSRCSSGVRFGGPRRLWTTVTPARRFSCEFLSVY